MPTIRADHATRIAEKLLQGAGAPENESKIVARHVISANLAGHDSHGIIQIPTYIERVLKGDIVPGAKWEIIQESPTTTVVDGHWGFGYVANERAMQLTIEKARQQNRNNGHDDDGPVVPVLLVRECRQAHIYEYERLASECHSLEETPRELLCLR